MRDCNYKQGRLGTWVRGCTREAAMPTYSLHVLCEDWTRWNKWHVSHAPEK